jgi:N-acetylglucosamine kinase-like BadF-type ATPase
MTILLGVDSGATKTLALLAGADGHVLGRGLAGPANRSVVGVEAALAAIDEAISAALANAGLERQAVSAVAVGLAGARDPDEQAPFSSWLARQFPETPSAAVHDSELALVAGTPAGWGVAVISGTGSIVYGRTPAGHRAYAGGWGYLIGGEGSGYWIGLAVLRAVARAHDGRGPATLLQDLLLAEWQLAQPQELRRRLYQEGVAQPALAALAELAERAAAVGDPVARSIVEEAGCELALAVAALIPRLSWPGRIPCALAGSVLTQGQAVAGAFLRAAKAHGLDLCPIAQVGEPALGALRIARRLLKEP